MDAKIIATHIRFFITDCQENMRYGVGSITTAGLGALEMIARELEKIEDDTKNPVCDWKCHLHPEDRMRCHSNHAAECYWKHYVTPKQEAVPPNGVSYFDWNKDRAAKALRMLRRLYESASDKTDYWPDEIRKVINVMEES
jgi:hypothetical protein